MTIFLLLLCLYCNCINGELKVAKIFSSHMVLQETPHSATIHGTYTFNGGPISVEVLCHSGASYQHEAKLNSSDFTWSVSLDPMASGEQCDISITDLVDVILLEDILFGDVWICSGQSNMGWPLGGIENGKEEVELAKNYTNIRMYRMETATADQPQNDILEKRIGWVTWNDPSSEWPEDTPWEKPGHYKNPVADFSAICFLFAKEMSEHLGNKPLGLIESQYPGTRIEAWSTDESLKVCGVDDHVDDGHPYNSNSYLYNAMIHPLQKMSIKGMVWYQGEANSFWNPDKYACTLHQMISNWRKTWSEKSDTNPDFPAGIVQLAAMANPPSGKINDGSHFLLIRWHQTLDVGYLPNMFDQNMFMSLALDTYYNGSVHSKYKQLPAKRLGIAGLSVAYEMKEFPSNGPFPTSLKVRKIKQNTQVEITYDENEIHYNPMENSCFFFCCEPDNDFNACNGDALNPSTNWKLVPTTAVTQTSANIISIQVDSCAGPSSLGYLWAESPVIGLHGLPIYSLNKIGLPATPWWKLL